MGERTKHEHGIFSWVDLASSDQAASKNFYSNLFGWEFSDIPLADGAFYSIAKVNGKAVAAVAPLFEDLKKQGIPSHWSNYVSVDNADEIVAKAKELSGKVHSEAFDVLDAGRMAVIEDPTGAVFSIWQARGHIGAELVNNPNTLIWNELNTRDADKAKEFYSKLFDWKFEEQTDPMPYCMIKNKDRYNGGIFNMGSDIPAEVPPHWNPYFNVESLDASLEKLKELGGKVCHGPVSIEPGPFAVVSDNVGSTFTLMQSTMVED